MNVSKLNQKPLEKLCEKALMELKVDYVHHYLYSLQLVNWALENHDLSGHWAKYEELLQDRAKRMLGWNPARVQRVLYGELGSLSERQKKPENLAMLLLENLEGSLNI